MGAGTGAVRRAVGYIPLVSLAALIAVLVAAVPSTSSNQGTGDGTLLDHANSNLGTGGGGEDVTASGGIADGAGGVTGASQGTGAGGGAAAAGVSARPGAPSTARDCARNQVIKNPTSCRPAAFRGDNGGTTHSGVTAGAVNVVFYMQNEPEWAQQILARAGVPSQAERAQATESLVAWFNQHFELNGRRVNLIIQSGSGLDASAYQADAIRAAVELKAFAVVTYVAAGPYYEELHRRGVTVIAGGVHPPESYFAKLAPHFFGIKPSRDLIVRNLAEYMCKRVVGRNAIHAGSPVYRSQARRIGVVWRTDSKDDGPAFERALDETCGAKVAKSLGYPPEIQNAAAIVTNIVTQMKDADVTSVTCICDPILPIFLTQQATNQGWLPEWIHNGYWATDIAIAARQYDQAQWSRSFGPATAAYLMPAAELPRVQACVAGGKSSKANCIASASVVYDQMLILFDALEAAGPALTDRALAEAILQHPPRTGGACEARRCSFGASGPEPYTFVDDFSEIWWQSTAAGPDGRPGRYWFVGGQKRYRLGEWPTSAPNVLADDGTSQPPRDPDQ